MGFAALCGVQPMIEKFPLAKVNEAYDRVISGKAQFRVVLTMFSCWTKLANRRCPPCQV